MNEENKDLYERLVTCHQTWKFFVNKYKESESDYRKHVEDLTQNKTRIELAPDVKELLDLLQHYQHEKSVGAYERLLTAFLEDVIPGERKIKMELTTERGTSALNIFVKKGEDLPCEDAYTGTGGSVSNILSVGLRAISLIRSGKRRFLVLDEADCWIKPTLIPRFASVVQQMSEKLGIQILMISHHDESAFNFLPHRLNLTKTAMGLETSWAAGSEEPVWGEEDDGIRSILLQNFQSHENTFLPLSPGVTLLTGDNDIGKSAIIIALRAVFYGEANDTFIRHYQENATVGIDFGNGRFLNWTRKAKKGSPKELYTLMDYSVDEKNPLHESPGEKGSSVPYWLMEETGLGLIDGLDVQLKNQKDPIFLLDETASVRAKALSVGDDSSYVQSMMKLAKEELSECKSNIKYGERTLENLQKTMIYLDGIEEQQEKFAEKGAKSLFRKFNRFKKINEELVELEKLEDLWTKAILLQSAYEPLKEDNEIKAVVIEDNSNLLSLLNRWEYVEQAMDALVSVNEIKETEMPTEPVSQELISLYHYWDTTQKEIQIYSKINTLDPVETPIIDIEYNNLLKNLLYKWTTATNSFNCLKELKESHSIVCAVDIEHNVALLELLQVWENLEQKKSILMEVKSLPTVNYTSKENDIIHLQSLVEMWEEKEKYRNELNIEIKNLENENNEINIIIDNEFPICPCCLRPWDEDTLEQQMHTHSI